MPTPINTGVPGSAAAFSGPGFMPTFRNALETAKGAAQIQPPQPYILLNNRPSILVKDDELQAARHRAKSFTEPPQIALVKQKDPKAKIGGGATAAKTAGISNPKTAITFADCLAAFFYYYPDATRVACKGNLKDGLFLYNPDNKDHKLYVATSAHRLAGVEVLNSEPGNYKFGKAFFGGAPQPDDIIIPMHRSRTPEMQERLRRLADALMTPGVSVEDLDPEILMGQFGIGPERESWAVNRQTGELMRIPHKELYEGEIEVDDGVVLSPLELVRKSARVIDDVARRLRAIYGDFLLLTTSTPPSGSPHGHIVNCNSDIGYYTWALAERMNDAAAIRDPWMRQIMSQLARKHGFRGIDDMYKYVTWMQTWTVGASHLSAGVASYFDPKTGRYHMDRDCMAQQSALMFSGALSPMRMLTAAGPYNLSTAMRVNGRYVRDVRELLRNICDTARPCNESPRDADHLDEIATYTMTNGPHGADRYDRSGVVNTIHHKGPDGEDIVEYYVTGHGTGRVRWSTTYKVDENGNFVRFLPTGRIEYTSAGSSSLQPRGDMAAALQIVQAVTAVANGYDLDARDLMVRLIQSSRHFRGQKITWDDVWGQGDGAVRNFLVYGANHPKAKRAIKMLRALAEEAQIPAIEKRRKQLIAALDNFVKEGDLHDLAQGRGTLGAAMIRFAERGTSPLEVAHIIADYQMQEQLFALHADPKEVERWQYRERGFPYEPGLIYKV